MQDIAPNARHNCTFNEQVARARTRLRAKLPTLVRWSTLRRSVLHADRVNVVAELLEGLAAFVVDSGFLDDVSAFVSETASELSSTGKLCESDNGEGVDHHAWTAYQELVKLADRKLEGFIRSLAMPAKEFQVACQQLIDAGAWVTVDGSKLRASAFLRAFTATWDFEKFIGLVVEEQNRRAPTGRTLGNHSP